MPSSLGFLAACCGALVLAVPAAAQSDGPPSRPLSADLDQGSGNGGFVAAIDADGSRICYVLNAFNIQPATAAHIHTGAAGENGPPVVPLEAPTNGVSGGCADIEPDLAQALLDNPADYYVNVHNADFPGGVVRGQLKHR